MQEVAQKAAAWALSKVGCPYSQANRTRENTFDCSSLVARAYAAQGKQWLGTGVPLSYQEVYDDEFQLLWPETYGEIGKILGGGEVLKRANAPGDLQFLCTDASTTRNNRITHVAMAVDERRIVQARGRAYGVCTNALTHYAGKVCAVVRYQPDAPLRQGMRGLRTLALQKRLNAQGAGLVEDGVYGPATEAACRAREGQVCIAGDRVHLRTGPGREYASVAIARRGDAFPAVSGEGWQPILLDGTVRWVSKKYARLETAQ